MKKLLTALGIAALCLTLTLTLVTAVPVAASGTWYVDLSGTDSPANGTGPGTAAFKTIGYGISQASSGDAINVAAGTYPEKIILKDGVQVVGAGPIVTIINGGGSGSVVTATSVGSGTKLNGFTITSGNTTNGGGMYITGNSSTTVTNCIFYNNSASSYGGGMYNSDSSPTVTNCIFYNNSAFFGGGMYITGNSSPVVTNCTFYGNSARATGGGMFNVVSSPTVTNCIFWGDGSEIIFTMFSFLVVNYCDIQGGFSFGVGNKNVDPLFVNPAAGNFHLQSSSPCIDVGINAAVPPGISTDIEGNARILDGNGDGVAVVDMGAYEYLKPLAVGGEVYPINKINVLAPWLILALAIVIGGSVLVIRRRLSRWW